MQTDNQNKRAYFDERNYVHSDNYFLTDGMFKGDVTNILLASEFRYPNDRDGLVQNFIVVDELLKRLGGDVYCYLVVSWNKLAECLNVTNNSHFRFYQYKTKPVTIK